MEDIKMEVSSHFSTRFVELVGDRPILGGVFFNCLSAKDRMILEAPFSVKEIKDVDWLSDCDESPSPDGVPLGFLKRYWSFVS